MTADSSTDQQAAKWRAAEKLAFGVCTSPETPVELRNEAIVRWAGVLNDSSAELSLLKKALQETEAAEGPDSQALLPLIHRLADLYSIKPSKRREALDFAQRGLGIRRQVFGETSPEAVEGLVLLGLFWLIEGMPDRNLPLAEQYLREAVKVAENACGPTCAPLSSALANLHALIKDQPGREGEAARIEERLEQIYAAARQPRAR